MVKNSIVGYAVAFDDNNLSSDNDSLTFDYYAVAFDCYTATSVESYPTFCNVTSSFE